MIQNGFISLVFISPSWFMILKFSKIVCFFQFFCWYQQKIKGCDSTLCIWIWKFSFRSSGKWYFIMTFYSLISRDCYFLSSVCDINFFIWKLSKLIFMGSSCFRTFWSPKYLNFEGLDCEIRILSCFIQETYTLRKVQNQFLLFISSWEPNLSDLMVYFCLFQNAILHRVEAKILKF